MYQMLPSVWAVGGVVCERIYLLYSVLYAKSRQDGRQPVTSAIVCERQRCAIIRRDADMKWDFDSSYLRYRTYLYYLVQGLSVHQADSGHRRQFTFVCYLTVRGRRPLTAPSIRRWSKPGGTSGWVTNGRRSSGTGTDQWGTQESSGRGVSG